MATHDFFRLDGPLDSTPAEGQMRIANLSGFSGLVQRFGADPRALLERHNIDPAAVRDPDNYIECKSVASLLEYCSSSLNDPLFGMQLAQIQDPDVYGCVTALCRAAPTVRDSLHCFIDYLPLTHSPAPALELVEGTQTSELRWHVTADLGSNQQANYQAAALNLKLLQTVGGRSFQPSYVSLAVSARQKELRDIERLLGCRFHGDAHNNAIAFPTQVLHQPVASANRLLYKLLSGYLEKVKDESRGTVAERVEAYVRGALHSGHCSIERCAQKMDVSVRTLQASLSKEGLRFSDILERQRIEQAKVYLEEGHLSLDDIAAYLGYAEQSSFGRAFKRWTSVTPRQYRQRAGGNT